MKVEVTLLKNKKGTSKSGREESVSNRKILKSKYLIYMYEIVIMKPTIL
jgi:hypothetical protein